MRCVARALGRQPARGRGGTADIVRVARERGRTVIHIPVDPSGRRREPAAIAAPALVAARAPLDAAARARHRRLHPAGQRPRHVDVGARQPLLHAPARGAELRRRLRGDQLAAPGGPLRRSRHRRQHPAAVGERRVPRAVRPIPCASGPAPHDRVRPRPDGRSSGDRARRRRSPGRRRRGRPVVARRRDRHRSRHPRRDRRSDRPDRAARRSCRSGGADRRRVGVRRRERGHHRRRPRASTRSVGARHRCVAPSISPTPNSPTCCARPSSSTPTAHGWSSSAVRPARRAPCSTSTSSPSDDRCRPRPAPGRARTRSLRTQRGAHRRAHARRRGRPAHSASRSSIVSPPVGSTRCACNIRRSPPRSTSRASTSTSASRPPTPSTSSNGCSRNNRRRSWWWRSRTRRSPGRAGSSSGIGSAPTSAIVIRTESDGGLTGLLDGTVPEHSGLAPLSTFPGAGQSRVARPHRRWGARADRTGAPRGSPPAGRRPAARSTCRGRSWTTPTGNRVEPPPTRSSTRSRRSGVDRRRCDDGVRPRPTFTDAEIDQLAGIEHERWRAEREAAGWRYGPARDDAAKLNPLLVPWADVPADARRYNLETAAELPTLLARAGFESCVRARRASGQPLALEARRSSGRVAAPSGSTRTGRPSGGHRRASRSPRGSDPSRPSTSPRFAAANSAPCALFERLATASCSSRHASEPCEVAPVAQHDRPVPDAAGETDVVAAGATDRLLLVEERAAASSSAGSTGSPVCVGDLRSVDEQQRVLTERELQARVVAGRPRRRLEERPQPFGPRDVARAGTPAAPPGHPTVSTAW